MIAHGWPEDVWFHVDNLSSAHIYLRMRDNETWDAIPEELLTDCAQLTKANSIEGNKKDNITVIYTPWSNLKKDGSMATGQVGFKDNKKVKRVYVSARENAIVNRLNKTKVENSMADSRQGDNLIPQGGVNPALAELRARTARDEEQARGEHHREGGLQGGGHAAASRHQTSDHDEGIQEPAEDDRQNLNAQRDESTRAQDAERTE